MNRAALAETIELDSWLINSSAESDLPLVIKVSELETDELDRARLAHLVGRVGLGSTIEVESVRAEASNLRDDIQLAVAGDLEADKRVEASCITDVGERTLKSGVIMPVELEIDEADKIHQHGRSLESVVTNTLAFAADHRVMRQIASAEALNALRIETINRLGLFDQGYVLVMESAVSDEMSASEVGDHFFVDTMTVSFQVVSKDGDGLKLESALVAGVAEPGAERHDMAGLDHLGRTLGQDRRGLSTLDRLNNPHLVHKSLLPNGAVDIVRIYDQANSTFFGHRHEGSQPSLETYQQHAELGYQRQANLKETAIKVKQRLLQDASNIRTPNEAIVRLDQISHEEVLGRALSDRTIDPTIFGPKAAVYIEDARFWQTVGDYGRMQAAWGQAQKSAKSLACIGKIGKNGDPDMDEDSELETIDKDDAGDGKGPLKFKCLNGHNNTRPFGGYVRKCQDCVNEGKDGEASVGCK